VNAKGAGPRPLIGLTSTFLVALSYLIGPETGDILSDAVSACIRLAVEDARP
jgi:hypothetical protein